MRNQARIRVTVASLTSLLAFVVLFGIVADVGSQGRPETAGLPIGSPERLGFSPERLARLDATMQRAVDEGRIAGMVTLIARRGQIAHLKAYGMADRERGIPMRPDAIFRLASSTKIWTTVALMQLMEEGRLLVTDPISKYIPAFKKTTVAVVAPPNAAPGTPAYTIVPAKREITIRDVLTKTPGIAYPTGPTQSLYEAADFHQWYFADKDVPMCTMMEKLPSLPFHSQPGERWMNGYTSDILGCVIEKITGMTLGDFMRTRIFEPLKLHDTYFFLPKDKAARLTTVYTPAPGGGIKRADGVWMQGQGDYVDGPRKAFSGGAGLLTTANDFARFLQMLLNGGELEGVRGLSPATVDLITANHVGKLYQNGNRGFGFNVEVTLDVGTVGGRLATVGDYGWQGAYFPRFLVAPAERMVAIFLAQLTPYGGASDLHDKFLNLVYQSLVQREAAPAKTLLSSR